MAELTVTARANYDKTRSERLGAVNARAIETANKRQARHNRAVDMCSDVVDGLFFLVFAVVDKRLELQRPLVLTDWLKLRKSFVQDTIRPSPPLPPPPLSAEEHVCLSLDKLAFSTLSGGWKVDGQVSMKKAGFEPDLISKYEKVLTDLAGAITHKEQHNALTANHTAAWTAFPQPFPYKVPEDDEEPLEQIKPTKYPRPSMRVRVCLMPDPVLSAKNDISSAPRAVARLVQKMYGNSSSSGSSTGGGSASPSPRPPRSPSGSTRSPSKRFSFTGSFNSEIINDDDEGGAGNNNNNNDGVNIPSEEAITNAVSVMASSLDIASSDPSLAMDAALLAASSEAITKAMNQNKANGIATSSHATTTTTTPAAAASTSKGNKGHATHEKAPPPKPLTFQQKLSLVGAAAQSIVAQTSEEPTAASSSSHDDSSPSVPF